MIPKCHRCGERAGFAYQASPDAPKLNYCHECFEIDNADSVDIKEMALKIAREHKGKQ